MKHENLIRALDEISQTHIAEAAAPKKRAKPAWFGAVAAVLAVAILAVTVFRPVTAHGLIAAPTYPEQLQVKQPAGYADSADGFFRDSIRTFLADCGTENTACSPLSVYMALSMLAESTGGGSRQQILDALGAGSIEALRTQAGQIWNAHYRTEETAAMTLANSLWLDEGYDYAPTAVDTLAESYYASVYQGDLGTDQMNKALQGWVNEQTKKLLKEQASGLELDKDCILALASTIYYNVQWSTNFNGKRNESGIFHTPSGDVEATYLRQDFARSYSYGEGFSAVSLWLRDGGRMWLVLPDEGMSAQELLNTQALDLIFAPDTVQSTNIIVHLSVPKFDIASQSDLVGDLKKLGITDVSDPATADFSPMILSQAQPYLGEAQHAARVAIDENGVTAAGYTVLDVNDAAAMPPDGEIDFILDRPFLFIIESDDGLPLFAGIVNEP